MRDLNIQFHGVTGAMWPEIEQAMELANQNFDESGQHWEKEYPTFLAAALKDIGLLVVDVSFDDPVTNITVSWPG